MKFEAFFSRTFFLDVGHRLTLDLRSLPEEKSAKYQIHAGFPQFEAALEQLIRQGDPTVISKAINDSYNKEDKLYPAGTVSFDAKQIESFLQFEIF
jgi:hypothetical protein